MAERVIVVCDVCGAMAVDSAKISTGSRNVVKDVCAAHLAELLAGSHAPRRGRRRGTISPEVVSAAPKRRGRPPKAAAAPEAPKPERRRITDPAILAKRRAALAKARQALADKRAAANAAG